MTLWSSLIQFGQWHCKIEQVGLIKEGNGTKKNWGICWPQRFFYECENLVSCWPWKEFSEAFEMGNFFLFWRFDCRINYSYFLSEGKLDERGVLPDNADAYDLFWIPDMMLSNSLKSSQEDVLNSFYSFSEYDSFRLFPDGRVRSVSCSPDIVFFVRDRSLTILPLSLPMGISDCDKHGEN